VRSDLMENIRKGIQLKKASDRVLDAPKSATSSGPETLSVAEILARRVAIQDSDDEEEEEDDDAWDD